MKVVSSAQFGGKDAASAVLPHFRALKSASADFEFAGFPRRELAFVLRVDGEVRFYGFRGLGHVDFDPTGKYVSIDPGLDAWDQGLRQIAVRSRENVTG